MFSQREIDFMRGEVEREYNARCRIQRETTQDDVLDPETLELVPSGNVTLYDDQACWYQATTRNYERSFEFGEAKQSTRTYIFRMSWEVVSVQVNDIITVLEAPDPFFIGRELRVVDPMSSAEGVTRVIIAELAQGF